MFSKSIDQKANKLKFNVDGYLTNDKKRQQAQLQTQPGVRREHAPTNPPVNAPSVAVQQPPKMPDPQIKSVTIQGKTYENSSVGIRSVKKQKQLHVYFNEQISKYKIEIKVTPQNSFVVRRDLQKGILEFQFKKAQKKKSFKEENTSEPKWMSMIELKDQKIVFVLANKEYLRNIFKIHFEGLLPEDQIKIFEQTKVGQQKHAVIQQVMQQDRGDDEVVKFSLPTEQQLNETEKFRKSIKDMKEDQKVYIITDIFKIKKEYEDLDRKKLKCPVFSCQKNYREITQLKTHLKKNHPELNKHGIQFTEFGTFEYSSKALDLALYLGKIFPGQMKKIIKKMKTKQLIE